jgi:predicted DNA-binding transcriptional regulator AlpA
MIKYMIAKEKLFQQEFINLEELKEVLNTSQNTIYRICKNGDLKKYKFLGKNYWRTEEIKEYLKEKGVLQ